MAVGSETLERLEKGFDRLERFFSRKKRAVPHNLILTEEIRPTVTDWFISTFPSPSFIRPISSRMVAREEANLSGRLARRAHSLPEPTGSSRLLSMASDVSVTADRQLCVSSSFPQAPHRASSLGTRTPSTSLVGLLEFRFPHDSSKEGEDRLRPSRRSRSGSKSSSRCSSASVSPGAQVTRKRRSVQDEIVTPVPQQQQEPPHPPASASSPRLVPLPEPTPDEFEMDLDLDYQRPEGLNTSSDFVPPPSCLSSTVNSILKEPTVDDFLSLGDDDIADGQAVAPQPCVSISKPSRLPTCPPRSSISLSSPPSTPTSPLASDTYPFLTLSPPLASRPAAAAAFEAAKLAAKYQFDLVYIVNLWPKDMAGCSQYRPSRRRSQQTATPSPPASPISSPGSNSPVPSLQARPFGPRQSQRTAGSGLTGRLLAAYGLTSLMFPFRISEPVHQKVLKTDGWLEYRGDSDEDYFTRGYSCSFYTGHSPDKRDFRRKSKAANRGIVFAAYRRPAADGRCIQSDAAELEALYRDAEELVDMLIDIHMTTRRPSVITPKRCAESTGLPSSSSSSLAFSKMPSLLSV
ncbi:hypothetical protein QBC43DRAFT_312059 [Cladorrhinum sp. PSN259]|nr:hypothetical protein QBC43DRAFT_312059 [Cladorrhinum sp. PSN259]